MALIGLSVLVGLNWGSGQEFSEKTMLRRLRAGMTPAQVARAIDRDWIAHLTVPRYNGTKFAVIARPGIGAWIVPQRKVILVFTSERQFEGAWIVNYYRSSSQPVFVEAAN